MIVAPSSQLLPICSQLRFQSLSNLFSNRFPNRFSNRYSIAFNNRPQSIFKCFQLLYWPSWPQPLSWLKLPCYLYSSTLSCALFSDLCSFIFTCAPFHYSRFCFFTSPSGLNRFIGLQLPCYQYSLLLLSPVISAVFFLMFYSTLSIIHLNTCFCTLCRFLMHSPALSSTLPGVFLVHHLLLCLVLC